MKSLIISDIKSYNNNGKSTGHYFSVAQNYVDLYSEVCNVKVAGGPIYKEKFNDSDLFLLPKEVKSTNSIITNKINVLKNAYYLFNHTDKNDIIVMQQCGAITIFISILLFAKKNRNNIYIIEYNTEVINSFLKRMIYLLAKRKISGLICPRKRIAEEFKLPFCEVTDYIYSFKRKNDSIVDKKYDFCMVGSIWPDKGVIEAAKHLMNTNYKLIIAGKPSDDNIKKELLNIEKQSCNIKLDLNYISEDTYYKYIRESKYCILNYQGCYNDRSSGVILDILFNNIPVIGRRCNATELIEAYNAGFLYNNINEFNPNTLLKLDIYNSFLSGISLFLEKQNEYRKNIISFLKLE